MSGEPLAEGWALFAFLGMVGHSCHKGNAVWVFEPGERFYVCPGCSEEMPEHLAFIVSATIR